MACLVVLLTCAGCVTPDHDARPRSAEVRVSRAEAVALAERFIRENGYTDAPAAEVKESLDNEFIQVGGSRERLLESRRNTLLPRAIGVKKLSEGWGVAFQGVQSAEVCRVVTMARDGRSVRIEHQNGICDYWRGRVPGRRGAIRE